MPLVRPTWFKWLVVGWVAATPALVFHHLGPANEDAGNKKTSPQTIHRVGKRNEKHLATTTGQRHEPPVQMREGTIDATGMTASDRSRRHSDSAGVATAPESFANTHPSSHKSTTDSSDRSETGAVQAIQLAGDVRLPAALIPHDVAGRPAAVAEATAEIANEYYRSFQRKSGERQRAADNSSATDGHTDGGNATVHGGDTALISNGPETEHIRNQADEQFRALYGDEKYNQHTIYSAIEVQLPP